LLSNNPGTSCNSGNNINSLCFTNANTDVFNVCGAVTPLSGNFGANANGAIDWSQLYGCDANEPGWAVQIYDCVGLDFGALTDATLTFSETDGAGVTTSSSYSTPVGFNSPINDNSCDPLSASIFQVETTGGSGGSGGGGGGGGGNPVTGNFTYTWSGPFNGAAPTTQDVSGLCSGDYSVVISNGDCEETLFFTVPEANPIVVDIVSQVNPTCFGQNNGSIDINVIGGSGNFTYQWIPQPACFFFGSTTQDVNNLPACTYTVSITDQVTGCNVLETITLEAPQVMELTVVTSQFEGGYNLSCHNSNDGAISVFVTGGTPDPVAFAPYDYLYDWINDCSEIDPALYGNDPNAPNANNLPGGAYGINVTDANGCLATTCFDLLAPDSIQSPAIIQNITCQSDEGCITPNVQGGSSTYIAYEWTGNIGVNEPNASTLCGLAAGAFTLTVTDSNGCQETFDYEIMDVSSPEAVIESTTPASCYNLCDGTATVTVAGGEAPYSLLVDGVAASDVVPGVVDSLCQGSHTLTITDVNGCETSATIDIDSPAELVVLTEILIQEPGQLFSIQCSGDSTGSVNGTVSGGSLPYDISWTDANGTIISLSEDISSLPAGQFCLNVIDGDACSVQSCVLLTEPEQPLQVTSVISQFNSEFNLACFNSTDGFIDLTVTGGVAPYTFEWLGDNVVDGAEDQSGLGAGVYDVVVIDSNFCQFSVTFELLAPPPIASNAEVIGVSCSGLCDAEINTSIAGADASSSISWTGPDGFSSTAADLTGLCAGDYVLSVADPISGCTLEETISIVDPGVLTVSINLSGDCALGTVTACAVVTGGTAPIAYDWSNGGNLDCANVTASGDLTVTVTDANGCPSATATENVQVPTAPFAINGVDTDASCGACNGNIDVTVTGGSAGFTYQWANGEQTEDLNNLCEGLYSVIVTDALGCSDELSFSITQSVGLVVTLDITNALCAGDSTGAVSVTTNGGTPEFTYSWTDADANVIGIESSIDGLPAGAYNVAVSDASGCDTTAAFTIAAPQALSLTITLSEYSIATNTYNISSPAGNNGSIEVDVQNGTPEYTYNWTPNTIATDEPNPTDLIAGEYSLQVVDANGCVLDTVITLVDPDALKLYTALSPNGDGSNDTYVIDGVQDCPDNQFKVFNRWGNLVYEKDSYLNEWFGQDMDGNTLSDGTYFVVFEGCGSKFNTYVDLRRN
jgi:gliding motility-associated-like protein